ncbi:hypothetical protein [Streptomyces sp. NPDC046870]|uniref:DUF6461 domain-containing protein n=1 Tax=Streptomyces sp. NPDC046870 TaxID=3155135 RepID=UPI0034528D93
MAIEGVRWLAESEWYYSVTFARGITPEELAARLGASPGAARATATAQEAVALLNDPDVGVARMGQAGGWAFAAEYGESRGARHDILTGRCSGCTSVSTMSSRIRATRAGAPLGPLRHAPRRHLLPVTRFGH